MKVMHISQRQAVLLAKIAAVRDERNDHQVTDCEEISIFIGEVCSEFGLVYYGDGKFVKKET